MRYVEPTEQELSDAKSAVRWLLLAFLMIIIATIAQIVWFIMLLTESPNTKAAFLIMIGAYILHFYCKWCSDDLKPESFK